MARAPSKILSSGTFSSLDNHIFSTPESCGNSPVYVRILPPFSASAWKTFSSCLYRNDMVSASVANALKSSHCLHLTVTGGP